MRLLLLEDDKILGDGLSGYLQTEGHRVDWFQRLAELAPGAEQRYDVLLVDWQLPDGSGLDWVQALRQRDVQTPVLILTANDALMDRVRGLDVGADDYLVKPFAPEELAARVRAAGRRGAGLGAPRLRCGSEVELDLGLKAAYRQGRRIDLTVREWSLLEALALRGERIVPKDELEALVHGRDAGLASNALEVHLSNVRRKLGRDIVKTVRGVGYRLNR